jgi:hypothetical protein
MALRLKLLAAVVTLSAGVAVPATALATTQSGHSGDVSATFSFVGTFPNFKHQRLKIVRAGKVLYDQPVTAPALQCGNDCGPGVFRPHASSVTVRDIESDGQPDVILSLFSGGANCCFIDQVFSFDPGTMTYVKTDHDFAYEGATIKRLTSKGPYEFLSANGAFIGEFTDNADSGAPIQIWSFGGHRFTDVTRQYPKLIAADAASWLRLFKHPVSRNNTVGPIAAWAADEELLGQDKLVQSTLASEARKGDLRSPPGSAGVWPSGKRFITALNRFLRSEGYLK